MLTGTDASSDFNNVQFVRGPLVIQFDNSSRKLPRIVRVLLWIMGVLILTAGAFLLLIPTFDGPHRLFVNEASAVSTLRTVISLEQEYSTAHPNTGYACELPLLKPIAKNRFPTILLELLTSGLRSGYRFSVSCPSDANRARVHYQLTAVPVEQSKTGVLAFCADEAGVIWYDLDGSVTNCFGSRHALQ